MNTTQFGTIDAAFYEILKVFVRFSKKKIVIEGRGGGDFMLLTRGFCAI